MVLTDLQDHADRILRSRQQQQSAEQTATTTVAAASASDQQQRSTSAPAPSDAVEASATAEESWFQNSAQDQEFQGFSVQENQVEDLAIAADYLILDNQLVKLARARGEDLLNQALEFNEPMAYFYHASQLYETVQVKERANELG